MRKLKERVFESAIFVIISILKNISLSTLPEVCVWPMAFWQMVVNSFAFESTLHFNFTWIIPGTLGNLLIRLIQSIRFSEGG